MSFFPSTTFTKPRSRRQTVSPSSKWVDLQPRERKAPGLKKVGRKGEFWQFVSKILNQFLLTIELPKTCEIQSDFCDGYHLTPAHTRRRQDIRVGNWWYALRVVVGCTECHFWADAQGRTIAESILEPIIIDRFKRLELSDSHVRQLLIESAAKVQAENPKFQHYEVNLCQ